MYQTLQPHTAPIHRKVSIKSKNNNFSLQHYFHINMHIKTNCSLIHKMLCAHFQNHNYNVTRKKGVFISHAKSYLLKNLEACRGDGWLFPKFQTLLLFSSPSQLFSLFSHRSHPKAAAPPQNRKALWIIIEVSEQGRSSHTHCRKKRVDSTKNTSKLSIPYNHTRSWPKCFFPEYYLPKRLEFLR